MNNPAGICAVLDLDVEIYHNGVTPKRFHLGSSPPDRLDSRLKQAGMTTTRGAANGETSGIGVMEVGVQAEWSEGVLELVK